MKKSLLVLTLLAGGCAAGPGPLHHGWDARWNKDYVDNPGLTGVLSTVVPVYPLVYWLAWIPDAIVLNTIQWWGYDLWEGTGTGYVWENIPADKVKKPWYEK